MAAPKKRRRKAFEPLQLKLQAEVGLENIEVFAELQAQLQHLIQAGSNTNSPRAQQRKQAILHAVNNGQSVQAFLQNPTDIRLCLSLWRENRDFFQLAPFNSAVLKTLKQQLNPPSRLQLWSLIQLYLEAYTDLPSRRGLASFLQQALQALPPRASESAEMHSYRLQASEIFTSDGHQTMVACAHNSPSTLIALCKDWHIPEQSHFAQQARQAYYLQPLEALSLGEEHPILDEIQQDEVKTVSMAQDLLLGHHAACLLMDKVLAAKADLPAHWRHRILAILDDPRVPRSSPHFQTWWGRLDRKYVTAMRTWLSKLDLGLFLNILEEVARTHNRKDLLRMYPARKRFLEGLHAQGFITESRLLLGKQVEHYVREEFDQRDLTGFGQLGSADASLIYLNLHGIHLLEGTHSFQVRVYRDLPIEGLADYEEEKFSLAQIRKYPADLTVKHTHSPVPRWQHKLIETLGQPPFNLPIEAAQVLSKADYGVYVEKFSTE